MHILITRPEADGTAFKSRVEALGYTATLAPLITIVSEEIPANAFTGTTAIIATSRNALRALATSPALSVAKSLPLYVVGPGSARLASDLGFQDVFEGKGTAADLVAPLVERHNTASGAIAHLSGDVTAFDMPSALSQNGVNVIVVAAYRSVAVETLSDDAALALKAKAIDAVILMSPRTAEIWADVAAKAAEPSQLAPITHVCLSSAVADALRIKLPRAKVAIADRPNIEDLLALIKRLATKPRAE